MRTEKLCIAYISYDENLLRVAGKYFSEQSNFAEVRVYKRGDTLINNLRNGLKQDIIILDEQLQDNDILGFLQEYSSADIAQSSIIIALCSKGYLTYTGVLLSQGVDYCMVKPFQMSTLVQRIFLLHQAKTGKAKLFCDIMYKKWGIKDDIVNCNYLTDAVMIAYAREEKLAIRKEILLPIATARGVSIVAVDSALRRLIEYTERLSTPEYLAFKKSNGLDSERPKIGWLIYAIKGWIEKQQ